MIGFQGFFAVPLVSLSLLPSFTEFCLVGQGSCWVVTEFYRVITWFNSIFFGLLSCQVFFFRFSLDFSGSREISMFLCLFVCLFVCCVVLVRFFLEMATGFDAIGADLAVLIGCSSLVNHPPVTSSRQPIADWSLPSAMTSQLSP